ncbi:MAG: CGNR zinc finger domain-containing protein [Acidimicrobiaceae bacterium]|nr:CGNR zinc finger domain-containing protein [Acidimicrobiaceae bacterium]
MARPTSWNTRPEGGRSPFAHDTEHSLLAVAALVNTEGAGRESLPDGAALDRFVTAWGWSGPRRHDDRELAELRALRSRLRLLWELEESGVVTLVNEILRECRALPQLVSHEAWPYHLHATPPDAPLAERVSVDSAMAVVDVVRQGELGRLRVCEADDCTNVLVDLSKNRSRRYCSTACLNRVTVAAYRTRQRARGPA